MNTNLQYPNYLCYHKLLFYSEKGWIPLYLIIVPLFLYSAYRTTLCVLQLYNSMIYMYSYFVAVVSLTLKDNRTRLLIDYYCKQSNLTVLKLQQVEVQQYTHSDWLSTTDERYDVTSVSGGARVAQPINITSRAFPDQCFNLPSICRRQMSKDNTVNFDSH